MLNTYVLSMDLAERILNCPRGRGVCAALAEECSDQFRLAVWDVAGKASRSRGRVDPETALTTLLDVIGGVQPAQIVDLPEDIVLRAVASAVDDARYWQRPDEDEDV